METIYILRGTTSSWAPASVTTAELLRTTPSGQRVVKRVNGEQRFDKDGWEIGGMKYSRDRIIPKEQYDRYVEEGLARQKRRKLETKISEASKLFSQSGNVEKEKLVAWLEECLAEAKSL